MVVTQSDENIIRIRSLVRRCLLNLQVRLAHLKGKIKDPLFTEHGVLNALNSFSNPLVQGPLQAIALAEICRRNVPHQRVTTFAFRAEKPAFTGSPPLLRGRPSGSSTVELQAVTASDAVSMTATATLEQVEYGANLRMRAGELIIHEPLPLSRAATATFGLRQGILRHLSIWTKLIRR